MARSKYINTFNTTAEYDNYIESGLPEFPNVSYDKEADKVNIMRTSPNDHVLYGEVVDQSEALPIIYLSGTANTSTLDTLTNMFYLDSWSNTAPTRIYFTNTSNLKSIKKFQIDTSNVTNMNNMFYGYSFLTSLDLSSFNTSNVTSMSSMFYGCKALTSLDLSSFNTSNVTKIDNIFSECSSLISLDLSNWDISNVTNIYRTFLNTFALTDVYITVEATLMKLTNNLSSAGSDCIPSSATIHYNDVDYKWQNNAWTPQS